MSDEATSVDANAPLGSRPSAVKALSSEDLEEVIRYAGLLLGEEALPEDVDAEDPQFFRLVEAFVAAEGSLRLKDLREHASLFEGWGEDPLTEDDRLFLVRLVNEAKDARHTRRLRAAPEGAR
jgi:hypothetical protein